MIYFSTLKCLFIVTHLYYATFLLPQGATFKANELLWAVYPPYTKNIRDILEVLDYELLCKNASTEAPSRTPLERAAVMQLVDAHDFGGRTISTNE
jgi:hypothetical protein